MPGYLVARIDVHDRAAFAEYGRAVEPIVVAHGGRYLIRGGASERLEGEAPDRRLVVIEFPSLDAARGFYRSAEYGPVLQQRLASSTGDVALVEGWAG